MKTLRVEKLKKTMNDHLAKDCLRPEARIEAATLFGFILTDVGAYGGFMFLPGEVDIHAGIYGKEGKIKFC